MSNPETRVAIIGGGRACRELLSMIQADPKRLGLEVIGVADPDPSSPGLLLARELNVPLVVDDYHEFFVRNDIELVIELTGRTEVRNEIFCSLPPHIHIVDHKASRFFWDLFARAQESLELRRRTRDQIRAERNRLKSVLDSLPYEILVIDRNYIVELANRTYLENNELTLEQVIGASCHKLAHRSRPACDVGGGACPHERSFNVGEPVSIVASHHDGEGRERFASIRAAPLRDEQGVIRGVVEAIRDITDRMEMERELLQKDTQLSKTRRRLNDILSNSRDIIFLADSEGRLLTFNEGAERSLGHAAGEVRGKLAAGLAESPTILEELLEVARREGHATGYELRLRHKNGESVVCNLGLTSYGEPGSDAYEIIGIARDITTQVRLQEEVFDKEQLAAIGKMAVGVAHEINNPLAVIDTIAGFVEETFQEEGKALAPAMIESLGHAIGRLRHQVTRAMSFTHSLLGFARNSGDDLQAVDLPALLDESMELLATEIKQRDVVIRRSYARNAPRPLTDRPLLQQVLVNLLTNAVDAMEENAQDTRILEVGVEPRDERHVALYVKDNGVGIPQEDQARIFELFHTSKPPGKGTGIGLAIVLDIVKRLGAEIDVASRTGQGSRFTVVIPVTPPCP